MAEPEPPLTPEEVAERPSFDDLEAATFIEPPVRYEPMRLGAMARPVRSEK